MEKITLTTEKREVKKHGAFAVREAGRIPAVIFGAGLESLPISVEYKTFEKIFAKAGSSAIITLVIGSEEHNVIVSEVAYDSVSDRILHVDFQQVRMDEKIKTEIEVKIVGLAPAVKEQGGIMINNIDKIEIECLPGDLIHDITVSVDGLKNLKDTIHVKDIVFPKGIEVLTPLEEVIVLIEEPRSEAELDALNEEVKEDVESVEGIKKPEPAEGEEAAEGEEPAAAKSEGDAEASKDGEGK